MAVIESLLVERVIWAAGAAAVTVAWVGRNDWTWPVLKKGAQRIERMLPGYATKVALKSIAAELRPNGGGSIRDAINRIESRQVGIMDAFAMEIQRRIVIDAELELATFATDENGRCVTASKAYLDLSGMALSEVLAGGWRNIIAEHERERTIREWQSVVEDGRDFHLETSYLRQSDFMPIPVRVAAYVVRSSGRVIGWVGVVRVIDNPNREAS